MYPQLNEFYYVFVVIELHIFIYYYQSIIQIGIVPRYTEYIATLNFGGNFFNRDHSILSEATLRYIVS